MRSVFVTNAFRMSRRTSKRLLWISLGVLVGMALLYVYNLPPRQQVSSVHQNLHLTLDLPKCVKDRDFLVKHYIQHLQKQLEDEAVMYKDEDETAYVKRKEYVTNYCKNRSENKHFGPNRIRTHTWYLPNPHIMYCPVAKSGSTFWRRALEVIRRKDPKLVSPFQLSYLDFKERNAKIPNNYTKPELKKEMSVLLQSTLKFVFARDPYHRVFSAFIDKILSPQPNMSRLGSAIVKFRPNSKNIKTCGSDVTFGEFVKLINAKDLRHFNAHLTPVAYTCDACSIDYDIIGKMETFQTDTRHILKKAQTYGRDIIFKDMSTEYKVDQIVDYVIRTFVFKSGWNTCISLHAGYQRLWRQLQIAGVIDITDPYPLTQEQSNNITVTEYLNMALLAFQRSSPSAKETKRKAYLQAYSMLSREDLERLRQQYTVDFEMFDYEPRPKDIYNIQQGQPEQFDYFDVMKLK